MKVITNSGPYFLELKTEDGKILAMASAQSGSPVPTRFFIWKGQYPEDSENFEGNACQTWEVKKGQTPDAVWKQIVEFEVYRVALEEWGRLRDQETRNKRFETYLSKAKEYVESISRYLDLKFELDADEDITVEVSGAMQAILEHLKEADQLADLIQDNG